MTLTGLTYGLRRLLGIIAAALVAVALVACRNDLSAALPNSDAEAGRLSFRVVTPKSTPSGMTRATWGDEYDSQEGNDFETALLVNEFWAVITDADCTEEIAVTALVCTRTQDLGSAVIYDFLGRINTQDLEAARQITNGKLHIVANAGARPTLSDAMTFTRWGQPGKDFTAIPMWGVQTVDLSGLEPKQTLDLGDISLLRAMAKVEIYNSDDDDNFIAELKSVTINAFNTQGYLLPDNWTKVKNTKEMERNAVRIPDQTLHENATFAFTPASGTTPNHVAFYLPELRNPGEANAIKLTLDYVTEQGKSQSGDIYFRTYDSSGEPDARYGHYDLRRNYLYRFVVTANNLLHITADVIPYKSIELEPSFGLDGPDPAPGTEGPATATAR